MSDTATPSGRQTELRAGDHRLTVVEVSGGLRSYSVGDAEVLAGYPEDQMASAARGQLLIPWPNRLHTGTYTWDGTEHTVPMNEPDQRNAIHGLTRWRSWTAEDRSESSVTMRLLLRPQPGYPFTLELSARYDLDPADGVTVTMTATNVGAQDAPYGCGIHPYVTVGTDVVDDAELTIPAETWLPTGPAQIPIGRESVAGTPYDFRQPRAIGKTRIDYGFTDLVRDEQRRATLRLSAPSGRAVEVWVDESFGYLEVFTADTVPEEKRRGSLGVEPMTCPPDAFRTGEDLVRLAPGESTVSTWGIRPC